MKLHITLFIIIFIFTSNVFAIKKIPVKGLENISKLEAWTSGFSKSKGYEQLSAKGIQWLLIRLYKNTYFTNVYFRKILKLGLNQKYDDPNAYKDLAKALLQTRQYIRNSMKKDLKLNELTFIRQTLLLLQHLADETLYAGIVAHKKLAEEQLYLINRRLNKKTNQTVPFMGIQLNQADAILSKGTQGSSAFLARITDNPGTYSHATTVWIDEDKKYGNKLLFPEAHIEDGVKLRDPNKNFIKDSKLQAYKFSVFRFNTNDHKTNRRVIKQLQHGVELFVDKMSNYQGGFKKHNPDPTKIASFKYDATLDTSTCDESNSENGLGYFCSMVVWDAARQADLNDERNPYPEYLWSSSKSSKIKTSFFKNILGATKTSFPAPSDLELNPFFAHVASIVNLQYSIPHRINVATVDVLIDYVKNHEASLLYIFDKLKNIGNTKLTEKQKSFIKELLPSEQHKFLDALPESLNLKTIVFFGLLNQKLSPQLQAKLSPVLASKVINPFELRAMIYTSIEEDIKALIKKIDKLF